MGWQDRDYSSAPASAGRGAAFGSMRMWSVTTWIIVINIAVFVIDRLLARFGIVGRTIYLTDGHGHSIVVAQAQYFLEWWGYFSQFMALQQLQLWRFITFQFLHAGLEHIFFNMLALYFFGPLVEAYLGSRRYLVFYLLSGCAGGLGYILLSSTGLLINDPFVPLIGASAGIFGVLVAAAMIAPDATVLLIFPPIPIKLKTLAWIFIGIAVYTVFSQGHNAGGQAAHLGGAVAGYLLIQFPQVLRPLAPKKWKQWR
jgi:membrane associated rhomboid family serine protease